MPRRSADAAVTSAVRGPTDACAVPERHDRGHRRAQVVQRASPPAAPGRARRPTADTTTPTRPLPSARPDDAAAVEHDLRQPVAPALSRTRQEIAAAKARDERVRRRSDELPGVPVWRSRPSTRTPTRSASAAASSKSCVTRSVGSASVAEQPRSSARTAASRVRVERGERLVEQQHRRVARERAGERDPLPLAAGKLARPSAREVRDPEPLEELVDARRVPP